MPDCARSIVHEPIVRPTEVHHMEKAADRVKIKETGCSNLKERRRRRGVRPRARAERAEARSALARGGAGYSGAAG